MIASSPFSPHRLRTVLGLALLLISSSAQLLAAALAGRITTVDRDTYVTGAQVTILGDNLRRETTTNSRGEYSVDNLPAGSFRVRVSYLSYAETEKTVALAADGRTTLDFALRTEGAVVLDPFVVEAVAEGQAKAINQQRNANTIVSIVSADAAGALAQELNYPVRRFHVDQWKASWITGEGIAETEYNVLAFRRSLKLDAVPSRYIIHVSADNRYKLYVNAKLVSMGPQPSSLLHWRYETIDLAPYLRPGTNCVAAEVVNFGPDRAYGLNSLRTGLLIQGHTEQEAAINTGAKNTWKCKANTAYAPIPVNWMFWIRPADVDGFYPNNPGDSLSVANYPKSWMSPDFDDAAWPFAKWIWKANSDRETGHFWLMKARTTPLPVQKEEPFARIARTEGIRVSDSFLTGNAPVTIPARSRVSLLLDFGSISLGFPTLRTAKGKDATITIRYAENLFNPDNSRGDRNAVAGKHIKGIRDVIRTDGDDFDFSPLWIRAFRYVQLDIVTTDEPLVLKGYTNLTTHAPMERRARFDCDDPAYKQLDQMAWQTNQVCTQDNLMSDAYYEQMMYIADSKVHALANLYLSGQDVWLRNAIEQFDYSRMSNGLLTSCYPVNVPILHTSFSLIWIDMIHDFMMHCDDQAFVRQYASNIRHTLDWFHHNRLPNGLVGPPVGRYFLDWYSEPELERNGVYGVHPNSMNGDSSALTLQYAATLMNAAQIADYLGESTDALLYRQRAEQAKSDVIRTCWDTNRQLFAEHPDKEFFDERSNVMAIAADVFSKQEQQSLFTRCLRDSTLSKPGYFFKYRHFEVMRKLELGDLADEVLKDWKALLPLNMTSFPERPTRQRSECHPWSTSPALAFINLIAGIGPASVAYKTVHIAPALGKLQFVKATYPHYLGQIEVDLTKTKRGGIAGRVKLPDGLTGHFTYHNKAIPLKAGIQQVNID